MLERVMAVVPARQSAEPRMHFLPPADIVACDTYRAAVRLAWVRRTRPGLTQQTLAEWCDLYPPHVSGYLHVDPVDTKGRRRLDLPADRIAAFEVACGNHAVSQYLTRLAMLTLMEEVVEQRRP